MDLTTKHKESEKKQIQSDQVFSLSLAPSIHLSFSNTQTYNENSPTPIIKKLL